MRLRYSICYAKYSGKPRKKQEKITSLSLARFKLIFLFCFCFISRPDVLRFRYVRQNIGMNEFSKCILLWCPASHYINKILN